MTKSATKSQVLIKTLSLQPNLYMHDVPKVQSKLQRLIDAGLDQLHIVADFDMTLTKNWVNGKRNMSSHGMFHHYSKTPESYRIASQATFDKYFPIEISTKMTMEQKIPHMVQWWKEAHEQILSLQFTRGHLEEMTAEQGVSFREGFDHLVEFTRQQNVPVLVFSAGITDVIESMLKFSDLYTDQMHVISNRMIFDQNSGVNVGFYEPIVHVFNKNEFASMLKNGFNRYPEDPCHPADGSVVQAPAQEIPNASAKHVEIVTVRKHVLLLGDSLSDIQMVHGLNMEDVITIGLMNRFVIDKDSNRWKCVGNESLSYAEILHFVDLYFKTFDIVIAGDGPFNPWILDILESMSH
ncbi:hypothetical protein MIR68_002156 [Amoeboaphelidium protococcarum]|nr:hypothetical protein MIR68_002156 [Amoeboaphelidium protococcarum]